MIARVTAILVVTLAVPAGARAASVSVYYPPCAPEQSKYGQCYPDEARFVAAAGEQNRLTVAGPTPFQPRLTFTDDGAPLTAGAGCTQIDDHSAACTGYNLVAMVAAGDGDDSVRGPATDV